MRFRGATPSLVWLGCAAMQIQSAAAQVSFEDRVAAQLAIERVHWERRTWPVSNPGPKPDLASVLPESAVHAKVARALRMSHALDEFWGRPIEARELQAELDRMIAQTQRPDVLREIFAALDHDPFLIAESVARPVLADRLVRASYAWDQRIHEPLRLRAEEELAAFASFDSGALGNGQWNPIVYKRAQGDATEADEGGVIVLDELAWEHLTAEAPTQGIWGPLEEGPDSFYVRALIDARCDRIELAVATWPKRSMDEWLGERGVESEPELVVPVGAQYTLAALPVPGCTSDTWSTTGPVLNPHERQDHSAVWTGSEMIVWGGASIDYATGYQTGSRYNPATDTWTPVSEIGAPSRRFGHAAVWTGSEMIIWGKSDVDNTGGRYNPATDTWTATSVTGAPAPRFWTRAVWTGSEMIVWGGLGIAAGQSVAVNTGGRYNPSTDTWTATTTFGAPSPRFFHTMVWADSEMIVWGGSVNTGARYSPAANAWLPTPTAGAPTARYWHTAVWTGSKMIVYGGYFTNVSVQGSSTGAMYDPAFDSWSPVAAGGGSFRLHTAVWTGSRMLVFGNSAATSFDPVTNSWTATPGGPVTRSRHSAVWTGTDMIVWGGIPASGPGALDSGGRYRPGVGWTPTARESIPLARTDASAIWTGAEMIVFGGTTSATPAGIYDPATASWTEASSSNAPSARARHSAIWTGVEMIVWGGNDGSPGGSTRTGGRYNPAADTWVATTSTGAPVARENHAAVWTGTEMIVYGGNGVFAATTGGRYDPASSSWRSMQSGIGRLAPRAVWTGSRMLVIGGGGAVTSLAAYDPATNTWPLVSTEDAPVSGTAVWTGREMIVWGGFEAARRYDPTMNAWGPISSVGSPRDRQSHTAVWTGLEMIVWGGLPCTANCYSIPTGGRYDPATDSWQPTPLGAVYPAHRQLHEAVWTGTEMLVWGGGIPFSGMGGRYCRCTTTAYADADGDGFGDPAQQISTPDCLTPPGHVVNDDDCDDGDPSVHPGVTEICDGVDQDCDGLTDEGFPRPIFPDDDGDLFGRPSGGITSNCLLPGYVEIHLDCNDANPQQNPLKTEVCNGIDDDCDSQVDEGLTITVYADGDGDGYGSGPPMVTCGQPPGTVTNATDCNDANPQQNPAMTEVCNGIDDDCDSQVDEGLLFTAYHDNDGDGFGAGPPLIGCEPQPGVSNSTDCDDTDPDIHPGSAERCNGLDDDCDSATDEGLLFTVFQDADGDGYGGGPPLQVCTPPPGTVTNGTDCNDADPSVHPGAFDGCNLRDDDCDGLMDEGPSGIDQDHDGVGDFCDNCVLLSNPSQSDGDQDGRGNACDNCPSAANANQSDADGDSTGDACDNCPFQYGSQADFDADAIGDVCDNCALVPNANQADVDADFEGDLCDLNDGRIWQFRIERDYIEWQTEATYETYNVYQGDLAILRSSGTYTQTPGSNPLAERACGTTDPWTEDFDAPPSGAVQFSLITGVSGGIESVLGADSTGTNRPNVAPCP